MIKEYYDIRNLVKFVLEVKITIAEVERKFRML